MLRTLWIDFLSVIKTMYAQELQLKIGFILFLKLLLDFMTQSLLYVGFHLVQ